MPQDEEKQCDVLIIGGGINGCGIAADAATRGLKVILCEKDDLASATSSASSKLIHGGLRYLEQYQFHLVRKALKEREILFDVCPYLIKPMEFILPHQPKQRSFWFIRLGLYIYDHLSKTRLPSSTTLTRIAKPQYFTSLKKAFNKAISYFDATTNDSRLVVLNALQAQAHGAEIMTRSALVKSERNNSHWISFIKTSTGIIKIKSKVVINATGPWVAQLNEQLNIGTPYKLSLVQGSHIVLPKLYEGSHAYILQNTDNRIIFTIPYHSHFTLVGTTDVLVDQLKQTPHITSQEKNYLISLCNHYFKKQIKESDIIHTFCGVRPLFTPKESTKAQSITRDYKLYLETEGAPYVAVYGGKLTTYRMLAKQCIDLLFPFFNDLPPCQTQHLLLPGSPTDKTDHAWLRIKSHYPLLPATLVDYYLSTYGERTLSLLAERQTIEELGLHFGGNLYQCEVDFLVKHEWAHTAEDIVWRRTHHGLFLTELQIKQLENFLLK